MLPPYPAYLTHVSDIYVCHVLVHACKFQPVSNFILIPNTHKCTRV